MGYPWQNITGLSESLWQVWHLAYPFSAPKKKKKKERKKKKKGQG